MAGVTISNARKSYGKTEVLHGIDLEIADGEFVVIVGPSGCGKSTLLRMVAGLESITSGEISIDGRIVNDVEPKDRDIAMVFQNYALYPHMSVFNNMAYGLKLMKVNKEEIRTRVDKVAKMLQLEEFLDRPPRALSGGQRQRVAMGRAIVREPSVFLFDEPLSNLDAKLRNQMRIEIRKLQRDLGVTAIYVTHDQVEAMTMADRIIVLNAGNVEQVGTPHEVYHCPQTCFVATFMGAPPMNLFDATMDDHGTLILGEDAKIPLQEQGPKLSANQGMIVGIRPEKIEVKKQAIDNGLAFELEFIEALGAHRLLHGKLAGSDFSIQTEREDIAVGDVLYAHFPPDALNFFDKSSQQRL